jgi:hypothetical protein
MELPVELETQIPSAQGRGSRLEQLCVSAACKLVHNFLA